MDIGLLLRESWRITRTSPALWLISLILFVAFVPAGLLSGGLAGLAAALTLPLSGEAAGWLAAVRAWPAGAWVAAWVVAVAVLVATSALTYLAQAALIHGAAAAAERGGPAAWADCLRLGAPRVRRLLALSLTVGAAIAVLSLAPVGLRVWLTQTGMTGGALWVEAGNSVLATVVSAAGLVFFLVVLAIAVEDVRTRQAPGRAWAVFRQGWWAFLLVAALSAAPVFVGLGLLAPVAALAVVTVFFPEAGGVFLGLYGLLALPAFLGVLLFGSVFGTTLYALVYRAAAQRVDAARPHQAPTGG